MANAIYAGVNNKSRNIIGGYVGVNGIAREIKKVYVGVNGVARLVWQSSIVPKKGDIITMNLDGTNRQYRVMKMDGNTAFVIWMWDEEKMSYWDDSEDNSYDGSSVDTYLNTTWYNKLTSKAKSAIVSKNIFYYCYENYSSLPASHPSYAKYSSKSSAIITSINRKIYALEIEEIEEYFGGTAGSISANSQGTFSKADIMNLFYNTTDSSSSSLGSFWLRSKGPDPIAYGVGGFEGVINEYSCWYSDGNTNQVRGAFNIDLTKIDFTINS